MSDLSTMPSDSLMRMVRSSIEDEIRTRLMDDISKKLVDEFKAVVAKELKAIVKEITVDRLESLRDMTRMYDEIKVYVKLEETNKNA